MQEPKDMREKNIEPELALKSTGKWKSQIMDGVMISNQPTDVMWQNRHIFPQQNHALMKILSKKCRALGWHSWEGVDKQ